MFQVQNKFSFIVKIFGIILITTENNFDLILSLYKQISFTVMHLQLESIGKGEFKSINVKLVCLLLGQ